MSVSTRRSLLGAATLLAGVVPATAGGQDTPPPAPQQTPAPSAVSAVMPADPCDGARFKQRTQARYVRGVFGRENISRRARRQMARMERCSHSPRATRNMRHARELQARIRKRRQAVVIPPVLDAIAACESGGDPEAVSGDGTYTGRYQFDDQTWRSVGGTGRASDADANEQDRRAAILYKLRGWRPWPICGAPG